MTDHDRDRTTDCKPLPIDTGIHADTGQPPLRQQADGDHRLADVDQHDRDCEARPLRTQRIRAARVAAAERADVDSTQASDQQAADQ